MNSSKYHNDIFQKHLYDEREAFVVKIMSVFLNQMRRILERVEGILPYLEALPSNHPGKHYNDELRNYISLFHKGAQTKSEGYHGQTNHSSTPNLPILHEEVSDQANGQSENSGRPRERAQAAFDEFPLGVSLLDHNGSFTYVNPKFVEIFGCTLREVQSLEQWLGKAYRDEQSCQEATLAWNEILANPGAYKASPWTTSVVWEDGAEKQIMIKVSPLGIQDFVIVYEDITERHQAEEARRQNEERCRWVFDEIPGVVFRAYADGFLDFFDNKVENLTGYTREQFHSRSLQWADIVAEEDLEKILSKSQENVETPGPYVSEYRIRRKDGAIVWVEENGQMIYDIQGGCDHISGVLFDITHKKAAESFSPQGREPEELTLHASNKEGIFPEVLKPASELTSQTMAAGEADPSQSQLATRKPKLSVRIKAGLLIIPVLLVGSVFCVGKTNFGKERVNQAAELFSQVTQASEALAPNLTNPGKVRPYLKGESQGTKEQKTSNNTDQSMAQAVRYMGSKTSNKYHYPHCKWAALIKPENLLTFASVKEAKDNGNDLQCPTCKPPLADAPLTAEKVDN